MMAAQYHRGGKLPGSNHFISNHSMKKMFIQPKEGVMIRLVRASISLRLFDLSILIAFAFFMGPYTRLLSIMYVYVCL